MGHLGGPRGWMWEGDVPLLHEAWKAQSFILRFTKCHLSNTLDSVSNAQGKKITNMSYATYY